MTNLETDSRAVVRFYNKRGTSEQWIKVGKQAVKNDPAELPSVPFQRGAAMAERNGIQHGQPVAVAGTPRRIDKWSLTCLQQRLLKTGGRLLKHARYYWLLLAESHLKRRLFESRVRRIELLPWPAG